jgi:putative ABC transport system substrate-binding protein
MLQSRRALLGAAVAGLAAGARGAAGQGSLPRTARVGWIGGAAGALPTPVYLEALRDGLRERGWVEGRNLVLQVRWGEREQAVDLTHELLRNGVDVIVAQGAMVLGAVRVNGTVPVVFGFSGDPVEAGLVTSFALPGGTATGIAMQSLELVGKRLEYLKELVPRVQRIGILANPAHPGEQLELKASQEAAQRLGLVVHYRQVIAGADFDAAFDELARQRVDALLAFPDGLVMSLAPKIAEFARRQRIGAVSGWAEFAEAGNLMTYGPSLRVTWRQAATVVDRLLRGARPADLPVEQPLRYELVLNMRTARELGLQVPQRLLISAERLIV